MSGHSGQGSQDGLGLRSGQDYLGGKGGQDGSGWAGPLKLINVEKLTKTCVKTIQIE